MKGKIPAFEIALSAIACAIGTVFLAFGINSDLFLASGYMLGSLALTLPLAKDFIWGNVLSYIATVLLAFLLGGITLPWRVLPFVLFFGLHPLVNYLQTRFHWNKILLFFIKALWFDVAAYLLWRFVFVMTSTFEWVDKFIIPVILVGGTLFFLFYDFVMLRAQKTVNYFVNKIKK